MLSNGIRQSILSIDSLYGLLTALVQMA